MGDIIDDQISEQRLECIAALEAENKRLRARIERLSWRDEDGEQVCRTCCAPRGRVHSYDCPAGEE